jgi:hypothetical protein
LYDAAEAPASGSSPILSRNFSLRTYCNLDLHVDTRPIRGRLRTERGAEEPLVGWLGFADALRRVHVVELGLDEPVTGP